MLIDKKELELIINLKKKELNIEDNKRYQLQRMADELNAIRFTIDEINEKL